MPKWLFYCVITVLIWGVWGIVTKKASEVGALETQILFSIGLIPPALLALASKDLRVGTNLKRGFWFGFLTGVFGGIGNIAFFAALNQGGNASIVYPLTAIYPLVTVLLAWLWLKERLNGIQVAGIGIALVALLLLSGNTDSLKALREGTILSTWLGYALVTVLFWGVTGATQKASSNYVAPAMSFLAYAAAFVPIAVVILFTQRLNWSFPLDGWFWAILSGALMGFGTLISFKAFCAGGKASVVTSLLALNPIVTVLLAVPLLKEKIVLQQGIGIAVALAAGLALSFEKTPSPAHVETKSN